MLFEVQILGKRDGQPDDDFIQREKFPLVTPTGLTSLPQFSQDALLQVCAIHNPLVLHAHRS